MSRSSGRRLLGRKPRRVEARDGALWLFDGSTRFGRRFNVIGEFARFNVPRKFTAASNVTFASAAFEVKLTPLRSEARGAAMKFRRRSWTPEEDGLLREYATTMSPSVIATQLKRTPAAIRTRERELGIKGQKSLKRGGVEVNVYDATRCPREA